MTATKKQSKLTPAMQRALELLRQPGAELSYATYLNSAHILLNEDVTKIAGNTAWALIQRRLVKRASGRMGSNRYRLAE